MAQRSQYPNGTWKIYKYRPGFVPKKADIAVWTYGWAGHTAIVVGPSDKSHFKCVDQNWVGSNQWSGSRAAFVNHNYNGNGGDIYFIRTLLNQVIIQVTPVALQQTTIKQSQSKRNKRTSISLLTMENQHILNLSLTISYKAKIEDIILKK